MVNRDNFTRKPVNFILVPCKAKLVSMIDFSATPSVCLVPDPREHKTLNNLGVLPSTIL